MSSMGEGEVGRDIELLRLSIGMREPIERDGERFVLVRPEEWQRLNYMRSDRDAIIEEHCLKIQMAVSDYTRRTPPHLRDCDVLTGHIVRALRNKTPKEPTDDTP